MIWGNGKIFMGWRRMTHACAHSPTRSLIHHRKSFMSKIQSSGWEVTARTHAHTQTCTRNHSPLPQWRGAPSSTFASTLQIRDDSGRSQEQS